MSSVSSVTPVSVSASDLNNPYVPGSARVTGKALGQQDFLKLLTTQLAQQDPMQPMTDMSFIGQMAQFTSLQQSSDLLTQFTQVKSNSDLATASSLLGKTVTVTDTKATSGTSTGTVTGVDASSGTPKLLINGVSYPLSSLQQIAPAVAPAA